MIYQRAAKKTYSAFVILNPTVELDVSWNVEESHACKPTGSAEVNVQNGQEPYVYQWSNGASTSSLENLDAGTYQLTVFDQQGCQAQAEIEVGSKPKPDFEIDIETVPTSSCTNTGEAFVAGVEGGTPPYQYQWSTGGTEFEVFDLSEGQYSLTVKDQDGCEQTAEFTIESQTPSQLTIETITVPSSTCEANGEAEVIVSGGRTPYQYVWNNGEPTLLANATNLNIGLNEVKVIESDGCEKTFSFEIDPREMEVRLLTIPVCELQEGEVPSFEVVVFDKYLNRQVNDEDPNRFFQEPDEDSQTRIQYQYQNETCSFNEWVDTRKWSNQNVYVPNIFFSQRRW